MSVLRVLIAALVSSGTASKCTKRFGGLRALSAVSLLSTQLVSVLSALAG